MSRKPRGLRAQAWILTRIFRFFLKMLVRLKVFHVTVINRESVPATGRVIIACNHISIADPIVLWGALQRNAVAIAMAELWKIPGVNVVMWLLGHIPVKRGNRKSGQKTLAKATRQLENDGALIIYPEGHCSAKGLAKFKDGVVKLAFTTGAPVQTVGIIGSNLVKPLNDWRVHRTPRITLVFGKIIDPADFTGETREADMLAAIWQEIYELSTRQPTA